LIILIKIDNLIKESLDSPGKPDGSFSMPLDHQPPQGVVVSPAGVVAAEIRLSMTMVDGPGFSRRI
jgi:hypothetical protein